MKTIENLNGGTIEEILNLLLHKYRCNNMGDNPNLIIMGYNIVDKLMYESRCHMLYYSNDKKLRFRDIEVQVIDDANCIKIGNMISCEDLIVDEYYKSKVNLSIEDTIFVNRKEE